MWPYMEDMPRPTRSRPWTQKLKQILAKKEYPEHVVNKEIGKFLKNRTTREQQQTPQAKQATVEK
jgi:hypothetical protein